jgi:uncharacterized membrane protein YphA (DoxX/SURF4 family)
MLISDTVCILTKIGDEVKGEEPSYGNAKIWGHRNTGEGDHTMNIALWVLQILFAALFMLHAVLHLFPSRQLEEILAEQNIPVKRTIATWAEVAASLGLILPGAASIATWLTPLAALGLAAVMAGATAFHMSRKETFAAVAAAVIALIMIFLACGRTFLVPLH